MYSVSVYTYIYIYAIHIYIYICADVQRPLQPAHELDRDLRTRGFFEQKK